MSSLTVNTNSVEFVSIDGGEPRTTTLAVAKKFGKRHTEVLRAARNIDCSDDFRQRNFASADYVDAQGKKRQMFSMTKDGFVFLVMGFTGKAAAEFKEWYIGEFNRMADKLNGNIGTLLERHNAKSGILKQGEAIASDSGYNLWFFGQVKNPKTRTELKEIEKELQPMLPNIDNKGGEL